MDGQAGSGTLTAMHHRVKVFWNRISTVRFIYNALDNIVLGYVLYGKGSL